MKKAKLFSDNPKKSRQARRKRNPLPVIGILVDQEKHYESGKGRIYKTVKKVAKYI